MVAVMLFSQDEIEIADVDDVDHTLVEVKVLLERPSVEGRILWFWWPGSRVIINCAEILAIELRPYEEP